MERRTVRSFEATPDLQSILSVWAADERFELIEQRGAVATHRKWVLGGFGMPPMMVRIETTGTRIELSAWVDGRSWRQLWQLFLTPPEMALESGGFRGSAPRRVARDSVNRLLERLGEPPIP